METTDNRNVSIIAASSRHTDGVDAAVALVEGAPGRERCISTWRTRVAAESPQQGALLAIVEGMRRARYIRARAVKVICPFPELVERLNCQAPTRWNDPLARHWVQARALSHTFEQCEFRTAPAEATALPRAA